MKKQKPKVRKIPASKRSRTTHNVKSFDPSKAFVAIHQQYTQAESKILDSYYKLSMEFCYQDAKKVMLDYFDQHGFEFGDTGILIPESIVLNAYNYDDLIIALKMQQAVCRDWKVEATSYGYDFEKDEMISIDYERELLDIDHSEIYVPMPFKVDRGNGIKTRWRGLEAEIEANFEEKTKGLKQIRLVIKLTGLCKFISVPMYREFLFLQKARDMGVIEDVFIRLNEDLISKGLLSPQLQPIYETSTAIPVNILSYFSDNPERYTIENEILKQLEI